MTDPLDMSAFRSLRLENEKLTAENHRLKDGDGDGTLPPMGEVDAKIAASEARTDAKFAKLDGKLDLMLERIDRIREQSTDARSEARATRRTVIGTGISLGALLIAILSLYSNAFNVGTKVDDVARIEAQQVYNQAAIQVAHERAVGMQSPVKALPAPAGNNSSANR